MKWDDMSLITYPSSCTIYETWLLNKPGQARPYLVGVIMHNAHGCQLYIKCKAMHGNFWKVLLKTPADLPNREATP